MLVGRLPLFWFGEFGKEANIAFPILVSSISWLKFQSKITITWFSTRVIARKRTYPKQKSWPLPWIVVAGWLVLQCFFPCLLDGLRNEGLRLVSIIWTQQTCLLFSYTKITRETTNKEDIWSKLNRKLDLLNIPKGLLLWCELPA